MVLQAFPKKAHKNDVSKIEIRTFKGPFEDYRRHSNRGAEHLMKVKKEYFILAAIIVALSFYLSFREKDRAHYELPEIPALPEAGISKIEIEKKDDSILLERKKGEWRIGPHGYPADNARIKNILGTIENLTLTAMVSESKDYSRYELDEENRITVKAYIGDKLVREFDIGKTAPSYRHTFVRLKGNESVYHARENFRRAFEVGTEDLRDKQVLAFDKEEIQELRVKKNGESLVCTRSSVPGATDQGTADRESSSPKEGLIWQREGGDACDKQKLNQLLDILSNLRCDRYLDNDRKQDLVDPVCRVELKGREDYVLSLFAKADDEDKGTPGVSSMNEDPFLLSEGTARSITKALTEMLGEQETKRKHNQGGL